MKQSITEKIEKQNELKNIFNIRAEKIVELIQPLQFNNLKIKVSAIMRDVEHPGLRPTHEHPNYELVINDTGKFINNAENRQGTLSHTLKNALLIPSGILHNRKYCAPLTINTTFKFDIESDSENASQIHDFIAQYMTAHNYQLSLNDKSCKLYKMAFGLDADIQNGNPAIDSHMISAFLLELLHPLLAAFFADSEKNEPEKYTTTLLVNRIKLLLKKYNNCKFFTNDFLIQQFNLSPNYLNRVFRQKTGMSIRRCWEIQRLEYIKNLIKNTNIPFSNIADMLDFSSSSQFARYVKSHFKETPTQMRTRKQ